MNWLTSLRDQLPLLLVLSPMIGFIATCIASRLEPRSIWHVAVSNMLCTAVILGVAEWRFEADAITEAKAVEAACRELSETVNPAESLISVRRMQDRLRAERLGQDWFAIDGINLFPLVLTALIVFVVIWQMDATRRQNPWAIPLLLLFESAAIGALTAFDLRVFLFTSAACGFLTSIFISQSGHALRRDHAERFLNEQFCSGTLITLGFSVLVIAVPWMKIPDSTEIPGISWNIASLVQDVQKWSARNELAFHYVGEVFPWMLMVLSVGFALQAGLFPFHTTQVRLLSDAPSGVALLYVIGSLSVGRVAWFRFVVPLAPDLLASFDMWMLIPSLAGAAWAVLSGFGASRPSQRMAYVFMALSAIAVFGNYCFSRFGMMGTWLMHQQIAVYSCVCLIAADLALDRTGAFPPPARSESTIVGTRAAFIWACLCLAGLFSSVFLIVSDLIFESLSLAIAVGVLFVLVAAIVLMVLRQRWQKEQQESVLICRVSSSGPLVLVGLLAIAVTIYPNWLLQQCEPEFAMVFRRFEQSQAADSAETDSIELKDQE